MNPYEVLIACEATTGKLEKRKILADNGNDFLFRVLKQALNPYITYGVKKFEFNDVIEHDEGIEYNFDLVWHCLHKLQSRDVTGHDALALIKETSGSLTTEQQELFRRILLKDLRCGVSVDTVNAVFKGLIPTFDIMLAEPVDYDRLTYPVLAEPKFNGVRNIAMLINGAGIHYSRNGREYPNFAVFTNELYAISKGANMVFDGEVTGKGVTLEDSFTPVSEQARRKTNVDVSGMRYNIFDVMTLAEFRKQQCEKVQIDRTAYLKTLYTECEDRETFNVRLVKGRICKNQEEVEKYYAECLADGWEGIILKNLNVKYSFKRCYDWVKVKPSETADLKIVGFKEGTGKYVGKLGALIVLHKGVKVDVGSGYKDKDREDLWNIRKKLIGKTVEVKFGMVTPDNSLLFPRIMGASLAKFITLRPDKD